MKRIKEMREKKRWTQEKLALESGMTQGMLSGIERGTRNPSIATLRAIASAHEVEVAELLTREEVDRVDFEELIEALQEKAKRYFDNPPKLDRIDAALKLLRNELLGEVDSSKK